MRRADALRAVAYSHRSAKQHAAAVTMAMPRYIVRGLNGNFVCDTDHLSYASAARLQVSGDIIDRWNWRD